MISLDQLTENKLVPVVVIKDPDTAVPLGRALLAGGINTAEVTLRTPRALEAIEALRDMDDLLVGAGTVINAQQVEQAHAAGAKYIVSPGFSPEVVEKCQELDLLCLPGTVTATEVMQAVAMGCETLKFFPAEASGGVKVIKALAAPFVGVSFIPTGGINENNVADYLALDCVRAVGGSWMVPSKAIEAKDEAKISQLCSSALAKIKEI